MNRNKKGTTKSVLSTGLYTGIPPLLSKVNASKDKGLSVQELEKIYFNFHKISPI
jgi:hypothetical protein